MTATIEQVGEAVTTAGRVSRTDDGDAAASGARRGFLEWVTRLVHTHRGRLYRAARREGLRDDDSLKLLSVLVRNHARNRRRRHEIARPHDSGDETLALLTAEALSADALIARAQDFALMIGCLDHLGKLQRAVVSLRMLDEVAGEDVAAMLGLPPSHVAVLLHRAKHNLRSCMVSAGYRP